MPIYSPTGFLDITNATLRTSNLEAENFKLNGGNIYVSTEFTPSLLVNGNVTSNTVQFTNVTTGLVTTANVQVGGRLDVTGDVHATQFHGDGSQLTGVSTGLSKATTLGTTKEFVVTASGGHFYIDGVQQDSLELHEGQTYLFDLTSTGTTHPFRLATVSDGGGGQPYSSYPASDYTTGTDYTSVANHLKFTVPVGAPSTLYYYCMTHGAMGGSISISTEAELIVSGRILTSGDIIGGCPVFFNAYRDAGNTSGPVDPIVWNQVTLNKGGGYDNVTGKFTAPLSGYYRFDVYFCLREFMAQSSIELQWVKNNVSLTQQVYAYVNTNNNLNVAGNITVYLTGGDTFHIKQSSGGIEADSAGTALSYTNGFSGFYLSS